MLEIKQSFKVSFGVIGDERILKNPFCIVELVSVAVKYINQKNNCE